MKREEEGFFVGPGKQGRQVFSKEDALRGRGESKDRIYCRETGQTGRKEKVVFLRCGLDRSWGKNLSTWERATRTSHLFGEVVAN